jgi:hypothetical protein
MYINNKKRRGASVLALSSVFAGVLLLPSEADSAQDPARRRKVVQPEPKQVSAEIDPGQLKLLDLMARTLKGQLQPGPWLPPAQGRSRTGLFTSSFGGEVLRFKAGEHGVRFESGDGAKARGSWDIGFDSLPSHVAVREFGHGEVIAVARAAAGLQERLVVGWLRWERTPDGEPALVGRSLVVVDALTVADSDERHAPAMLATAEILAWDPQGRTATLVVPSSDPGRALEVAVAFTAQDKPLPTGAGGPWWAQRSPRTLEARPLVVGEDLRALLVDGLATVLHRSRPTSSVDPFAPALPLVVTRRGTDGAWSSLLVEDLLVEAGYVAWTDAAGELCVSTPRTGHEGESSVASYRLSAGSWSPSRPSAWHGRMAPGARLVVEGANGPNPAVVIPSAAGTLERVPVDTSR